MNSLLAHPALLYCGQEEITEKACKTYLKQNLCTQNACNTCSRCKGIEQQQHHSIIWMNGAKGYKKEDIEQLITVTQFKRTVDDPLFIVCAKADTMNHHCANSLLKVLEEPPQGYQWILLVESLEKVVPTIQSRCLITTYKDAGQTVMHPFCTALLHTQGPSRLFDLHTMIEDDSMSELDAEAIALQCMTYYKNKYTASLANNEQSPLTSLHKTIATIEKLIEKPLMPGSTKLFLRTLVLITQPLPIL